MKRLIGYGTTNSSGVATITTSPTGATISGYTGVGAGKIDIVAELHDDSTIQSEPYIVYDCIKYDTCTLADSSKNTFSLGTNATFTRYDTYGALTETTSGTDAQLYIDNLPTSVIIDFEYLYVDGSVGSTGVNLLDYRNYKTYVSLANIGYDESVVNTWFKLRVTIDNGSVTMTDLDNPSKTATKSYTGTVSTLGWNTGSAITEVRLKNVKVYPI